MTETWKTAITQIKPNEIRLRGYRIDDLMGNVTFAQAIYLALCGELPSPNVGRLKMTTCPSFSPCSFWPIRIQASSKPSAPN